MHAPAADLEGHHRSSSCGSTRVSVTREEQQRATAQLIEHSQSEELEAQRQQQLFQELKMQRTQRRGSWWQLQAEADEEAEQARQQERHAKLQEQLASGRALSPDEGECDMPSDDEVNAMLRRVRFFRMLDEEGLAKLRSRGFVKKAPRYATIIREGVLGQYFYVLLRGKITCTASSGRVNVTLTQGAYFGEGALVAEVRRQATVTADEHCILHQWNAADVHDLEGLELGQVRQHVVSQILRNVYFFGSLPDRVVEQMSLILSVRYFNVEEVLFNEGDPGDAFFVLAEGQVVMRKSIGGTQRVICRYTASTERPWFGEMSLWRSQPRAATAICSEPTIALVLKEHLFGRFLELVPTFENIINTSQSAYATINALNRRSDAGLALDGENAPFAKAKRASDATAATARSGPGPTAPATAAATGGSS